MVRNGKARKQATDIPDETLDKIRNSPKSNVALAREHNLKLHIVAHIKNGTWKQATINTLRKLSEQYDIPLNTLQQRFHLGDRGGELIRPITYQNIRIRRDNTSGVRGVSWSSRKQKWRAEIKINRKHIYLGAFKRQEDAIAARQAAELKYFGQQP